MRRFFINVASNYSVAAVDAVLLIVVTPLIVQNLGVAHYSVWIIVQTLGYFLGFLDFGLPDAQIRQHAKLKAWRDHDGLARLHGTTLALYLAAGIAGLLIAGAGALTPLQGLLDIGADLAALFPLMLLAVGLGNLFTLLNRGITAVYQGEERFDVVNVLQLSVSIARASCVIVAMLAGYGLMTLLVIQIVFGAVACVVKLAWLPKIVPDFFRFRLRIDASTWRSIRGFTLWNSLNEFMTEGTARFDRLLIPILLSSVLVGPYSLVIMIAAVVFVVAEPITNTFLPMFSRLSESKTVPATRSLLSRGARLVVMFTLPVAIVILFFGGAVLDLWIGPEYTDVAPAVLWFSVANFFFSTWLWTPLNVLMAAGRIRQIFWISLGEVLLTLALIVLLVPYYELPGLALAGLIGNVLTGAVFFVPMACREAQESIGRFARGTLFLPLLGAAPAFAAACLLIPLLDLGQWLDTLAGSCLVGLAGLAGIAFVAVPKAERLRYVVTFRQLLGIGR